MWLPGRCERAHLRFKLCRLLVPRIIDRRWTTSQRLLSAGYLAGIYPMQDISRIRYKSRITHDHPLEGEGPAWTTFNNLNLNIVVDDE